MAQVAITMERFRRKTRSLLVSRKPGFMSFQMFDGGGGGDPPPARGGYSADYVKDLRDEAADWRKKLRTAEEENGKVQKLLETANKKATDLEGQNKTFLESVCKVLGLDASKVKTEDAATEIPAKIKEAMSQSNVTAEKAQEALRKSAFIASAVKQGIRKEALEDAYKLADFSSVKVDLDSLSVFQVDKDGKQITKDNNPVAGLDSLVDALAKEKAYLLGKSGGVGGSSNPPGGGGGNLTPEEEGKAIAEERVKARQAQAGAGLNPWEPAK